MKKIRRLINREITGPSLIALVFMTFIVFTREFGRLAEILIRSDASSLSVLQAVVSLLPSILAFSIPLSFLVGTLIGFSRLSSDSEIVAMRASGVSVNQMVQHVFKVGILVSLVTFSITLFLLPAGNWSLRQLRHGAGLRPVRSEIKPRVFNEDLPGTVLYVADRELKSSSWKGVFLSDTTDDGQRRIVLAQRGQLLIRPDGSQAQLHLQNGTIYRVGQETPERNSLSEFHTLDVPIRFPSTGQASAGPKGPEDKHLLGLLDDLDLEDSDDRRAINLELHRRLAVPLSPLIFAILGVTLGARSHRGGRGYGFIVSVLVALIYYVLFATGFELSRNGVVPILVGVWGSNIALGIFALFSLRYATLDAPVRIARHDRGSVRRLLSDSRKLVWRLGSRLQAISRQLTDRVRLPRLRPRATRVIDLYLMKTFTLHLLLTLGICVALFYLFTFFELIDDVFKNETPYSLFLDYFFYLLPHILMLLVPLCILMATLITFGLLDKTGQIVALKACGVSIYRAAASVLVMTLALSVFIFVLQEYFLPYANQRQDNLRNTIKGRPIQTYYQAGRRWIFGEGNRLYRYNHFDTERSVFAEISIYALDISNGRFMEHVYAQRAQWDGASQEWILANGWKHDLVSNDFGRFNSQRFSFPERPSYFTGEVKESSKMTYLELEEYIQYLHQGGFEVDHLKTDLHKKLALPLVSLIMAILGIPFSFTMGRKGALYGIAAGVLIGIFYWGTFGVFGALGAHGLLSPLLAAWAPNLLFAVGGTLLLSTVRT